MRRTGIESQIFDLVHPPLRRGSGEDNLLVILRKFFGGGVSWSNYDLRLDNLSLSKGENEESKVCTLQLLLFPIPTNLL